MQLVRLLTIVLLTLCFTNSNAQMDDDKREEAIADSLDKVYNDSLNDAHAHSYMLTLSNLYMSRVVYRGRDFGLQQHGFVPQIQFKIPSGFFVSASGYNWSKIDQPLARWDICFGYEHKLGKYLNLNASFDKWFFSDDPYFDPDALNKMASIEVNSEFEHLNFNSSAYYIWGTDDAFLLNLGLDYSFDVFSYGKHLYIYSNPGVLAEAFSGDNLNLIVNKKGNIKKSKLKLIHENLSMANYELSLPVNMEWHNFEVEAAYRYAYPIAITNEDPPISPYLKGGFSYFTLNISHTFYFPKKHAQSK